MKDVFEINEKVLTGVNLRDISEVIIPEGVEEIGNWSFSYCSKLKSIVLPKSLKKIGISSFYECVNLEKIIILGNLEIIDDNAFYGCSKIKELNIPDSVIKIGESVFEYCISLSSLSFPASIISRDMDVESYLMNIFGMEDDFEELKDFNLSIYEDRVYIIKNNEYKDKNKKELIIPYGVTEIKECDFAYFTNLESIVLPESIKIIRKSAFEGCYNLKKIVIGNGVEKIEGFAFSKCRNLRQIFLPNSILEIGEFCFFGCENLYEIKLPDKIKKIEISLFENCENLKDIYIPSGVEIICKKALYNCGCEIIILPENLTDLEDCSISHCCKLKKIVLYDNIKRVGNNLFDDCPLLTFNVNDGISYIGNEKNQYVILVNCTDKNILSFETLKETKIIKSRSFINCDKLVKIIIHDDVIQIGKGAFENCCSIESITLPYIGNGEANGTFGFIFGDEYDESLENTDVDWNSSVPQTIKKVVLTNMSVLPSYSFAYCKKIERIVLPDSLKEIKSCAFLHCKSLAMINSENVGEIIIPKTVVYIGKSIFYGCDLLDIIKLNGKIEFIDNSAFRGLSNIKRINSDIDYEIVIPKSVKKIGNYSFSGLDKVKKISILGDVEKIGDNAFENCSNLEDISISGDVIEIGENAFEKCGSLKNIFIGESIRRIGEFAFYKCDNDLVKHRVLFYEGDANSWLKIKFENRFSNPMVFVDEVYFKQDNKYSLAEEIIISEPNAIVGNYQFCGLKNIMKLKIINGVQYLGKSSFEKCELLNEIEVLGDIHWVCESIFKDCNSLRKITFPKVLDRYRNDCHLGYLFGAKHFNENEELVPYSLKYVKLIKAIYSIPKFMFYKCRNIEKIILPNNVGILEKSSFEGCWSLKKIKLPKKLIRIRENAFKDCYNLCHVEFNSRLEEIEKNVFYKCYKLSNVNLPKDLKYVHHSSFDSNVDLCELISETTEIYGDRNNIEIYHNPVDDFSLRGALEGVEDAYYNLYGEWPDDEDW